MLARSDLYLQTVWLTELPQRLAELVKRKLVADERLNVDSMRRDQIDCMLHRPGIDERTSDRPFIDVDIVRRHFNPLIRRNDPKKDNRSAPFGDRKCLASRDREPSRFKNNISAPRIDFADSFGYIFRVRINSDVGRNIKKEFPTIGQGFGHNDFGRPGNLGKLGKKSSDRSPTEDQNRVARPDLRLLDSMQNTGQRFHHRAFTEVHRFRENMNLRLRNRAEFGKPSILPNANRMQVLAQVLLTVTAESTTMTVDVRVDTNTITDFDITNRRSHSRNHSGKLVPGNQRQMGGIFALENVQIRPA